jgi:uncharacterized protein (DUF4415 family)
MLSPFLTGVRSFMPLRRIAKKNALFLWLLSKTNVSQLFGLGGVRCAELSVLGGQEMAKKKSTTRYTTKQLGRVKGKTDWVKARATTQAQIAASIASDPDEAGLVFDWDNATVDMPQPKAVLNMRVDRDILEFFKKKGRGYQTKINAVLRSYVERSPAPRGQ